ncbi:hypothetical protein CFIMG_005109RA [Ceratocystis fimbriata CBS 114723]|uniref:PAS domain-containing protein n=1 Tax=Ceratocystis fimbriata CBS 114723 TaxID=1035309 RepID=A0A2C5X4V9_9PEZI|nr:hypothetical protein CFIMG_005109RA [Ceratocystis fimbriata CBS 114723]
MEVTFMTMNDLTDKCRVIFATESVYEILGYTPEEAKHRSVFDFIHPAEQEAARRIYSRAALLDKATVLHTLYLLTKGGDYIRLTGRAQDAPRIRQLFKCSSRDPMYHMLEQLSPKYKMPPMDREPRAFLILNRFTCTSAIMFATDSVFDILGISSSEISDKSFYDLVHRSCRPESITCLENAKANDSLAYLRFWYQDPRVADDESDYGDGYGHYNNYDDNDYHDYEYDDYRYDGYSHERQAIRRSIEDNMPLHNRCGSSSNSAPIKHESSPSPKRRCVQHGSRRPATSYPPPTSINPSSTIPQVLDAIEAEGEPSWISRAGRHQRSSPRQFQPVEIEAVISCTSDGVGVVIRRARPPIPTAQPPRPPSDLSHALPASPYSSDHRISPSYDSYDAPEEMYTFRPLQSQHIGREGDDFDPAMEQHYGRRITR